MACEVPVATLPKIASAVDAPALVCKVVHPDDPVVGTVVELLKASTIIRSPAFMEKSPLTVRLPPALT